MVSRLLPDVIKHMGNAKSTSTHDLNRAGHELLGDFYRGAYPAGSEPDPGTTDNGQQ